MIETDSSTYENMFELLIISFSVIYLSYIIMMMMIIIIACVDICVISIW
jgi:hypothetical protein